MKLLDFVGRRHTNVCCCGSMLSYLYTRSECIYLWNMSLLHGVGSFVFAGMLGKTEKATGPGFCSLSVYNCSRYKYFPWFEQLLFTKQPPWESKMARAPPPGQEPAPAAD
ncbi:hypothetical protein L1987_52145 [Smallanthus sonchifolius]|uniref:Uncharacterized protein n=1 Tax=Smallanthus sonchifolius TaxID=185202 RepID=A0ACB9ERR8_9ASTR|nr:hypothetical protein L1987_52145 [Smallanthus sonchifolius]